MSDRIVQARAAIDEHRDAMPVAEALLYRRGAEVCDVLRHEVLRLTRERDEARAAIPESVRAAMGSP